MNHPPQSVYQQVIEKTKGAFFRTQVLRYAFPFEFGRGQRTRLTIPQLGRREMNSRHELMPKPISSLLLSTLLSARPF